MFRPQKAAQMTTPCKLLKDVDMIKDGGHIKRGYKETDRVMFCNFSTYNSTEIEVNGLLTVEENTIATMWYDPEISASCRIKRLTDCAIFEIVGEPENVEMRNMFCIAKVRRVRGGA